MKRLSTLLTILFFMAGSAITAQNIIYVTPNGTGNGSSWATATGNLQAAIDNAATQTPKPDIWVAAGTYYGDSISTHNAFTMADGVDVYGGFAGNEPANYDLALRDFETNETVLDGQYVQRVLCQAAGFTDTTTWDGFSIRNGNRTYYSDNGYGNGGGAYLRAKSVLSHCNITNNTSSSRAGGVYAESTTLTNCNISNNTGGQYGGGVYVESTTLTNCNISNNTGGQYGGGVYVESTTLTNCNISNNISSLYGGGVYAYSNSQFINCDIVNNQSSYYGGGVYSGYYDYNTYTNCIIWGNKVGSTANQIYGSSTFNYCAIEGGYTGEGNILLNAENNGNGFLYVRFVNPSSIAGIDTITQNIDWRLQENSICINRGNDSLINTSFDLGGNTRIQQNRVDIGCYESPYQGVVLPTYPDGIIYVKEGGNGTMIGTSWSNAMANLQDAIIIAQILDLAQVWVAGGTYYGDSIAEYNAFTMADGVDVYGGFAGNEPANYDLNLRNFETNETVLDGQHVQRVLYQAADFTDTTTWNGFTIRNGKISSERNGGGTYLKARSILSHCKITNNTGGGAAVYKSMLSNCIIANNTGYMFGGLRADESKIINCNIVKNYNSYRFDFSGGIDARSSIISNCIIWGNEDPRGPRQIYKGSGGSMISNNSTYDHCAIEGGCPGIDNIFLESESNGNGSFYVNFVNPSLIAGLDTTTLNIDWNLQQGSICVNRGRNTVVIDSTDYEGNIRIQNDTVDIGCYETSYHIVPLPPSPYTDSIVYVVEGGDGNMNGISWNNALPRIQDALDQAMKFHLTKVYVATGIYRGDSVYYHNAFTMADGVNVYGGFAGNEPANYDLSLRDFETNETVLDGQHVQVVLYQLAEYYSATSWDGFTIRNGNNYVGDGGGVTLCFNSILNHCKVYNNYSGWCGGGIKANNAIIMNCNVFNNTSFLGGGIRAAYSTLVNCNIFNNLVSYNGQGGHSGGIYAMSSTLNNCNILNNKCAIAGGGVTAFYYSTLNNCNISNNTSGGYAGGVETYSSKLTNCNISNNTSGGYAGGVYTGRDGVSQFINCDIVNNKCDTNATGGGVYNETPIYNNPPLFTNCIIYGNKQGGVSNQIYDVYNSASFSYCAVEGGYSGTSNINLSADNSGTELHPFFVNPSPIAGVDTVTQNIDWHLFAGSACIDAGTTDTVGLPAIDLDGNIRIRNGRIDIGAYEYNGIVSYLAVSLCASELPYHYINGEIDTTFALGTPALSISYFSLSSSTGCDSTVILRLTVNPTYYYENEGVTCANEPYAWDNHNVNIGVLPAGTHTIWDSLTTTNGCDSVYKLTLTVEPTYNENIDATICASEIPYHYINGEIDTTFQIGTPALSISYFSLSSSTGCDSTVILRLTVNPTYYYENTGVTCANEPYVWENHNVNIGLLAAGTHTVWDSLTTVNGCDSVYKLTLTVNPIPTVTISGNTEIHSGESTTLTASGALDYLWSTEETTESIVVAPTDTTLFAVIGMDENGCLGYDTIIVNVATGIVHYDLSNNILLFPNPATNFVELQMTNDKLQINEVEVYDMMGKLVKTTHALSPQSATINVSNLSAGTYFVRVRTLDGNMVTRKFVKK